VEQPPPAMALALLGEMFYLCSLMSPAPATPEMLAEMSACAYRLGLTFAHEAERAEDPGRRLEMYQLFDRCFFAVRVATALQLRLRREAGAAAEREGSRETDGEAEDLRDPAETERPEPNERERIEADRDRDREREPASLPVLLGTLKGVAADAAALPGRKPGELPTLQDLLARATAAPSSARPTPPSTSKAPPLRERLAGSAAVAVATVPQTLRPSPGLAARRATGPPRR
jgi:hypothetical protein